VNQFEFPQREYEPIQPKSGLRQLLKKIGAPLAAVGALLVKFGAVLFKAKFLFSIFVSAAIYVWIGGWWFGIGLVVLLFVHEMGHVLEAKRQGLPVSAPFFIPFLGAAIQMKRMPQSAWHEALNGIAGPILGSLGAAVVWAIGAYYDSRPLIALAFLGFLINLFNLIPFLPLDGGRIAVAIHPGVVALGLAALVVLVFIQPNPILILILIFGGMETWRRWQMRDHPETQQYYKVRPWQRIVIALLYFSLAALLVIGVELTHVPRSF
jgi:Zn-dependent protease